MLLSCLPMCTFGICNSLFTRGFLAYDQHPEPLLLCFPMYFLPLGPVTTVCVCTNYLQLWSKHCSFALVSWSPKD